MRERLGRMPRHRTRQSRGSRQDKVSRQDRFSRRRAVTWRPGWDTAVAAVTLLVFWGCYWAGTTLSEWFLAVGVVIVGTLIPAIVVFRRGEGWAGLGVRRRFWVVALIVSAVLGIGSVPYLLQLTQVHGTAATPHLLANLLVLWEPLFVFGWLFGRWERAFGWLPAIVLTAAGFALQHVGSVPLTAALGFGGFAIVYAVAFAAVRNLLILWPLFYPVGSAIGTLQAGHPMGWPDVLWGAGLIAVQALTLGMIRRWPARPREQTARGTC